MEDQLWYGRLPELRQTKALRRNLLHLLLIVQLFALLPLTSCTAPAPTAVAVTGTNVQPLLLSLAEEEPDLAPRMIVQFSGDAEELAAQVEALGG